MRLYLTLVTAIFCQFLFAQDAILVTQQKNLEPITLFEFDEQAKYVASVDDKKHIIKIWDVRSSKLIGSLHGHDKQITCIAFSENGESLYSCDKGNNHKLWSLNDWQLKDSVKLGFESKKALFAPSGLKIVALSKTNEIIQLNPEDLKEKGKRVRLTAAAKDMTLAGDEIVISTSDRKLKFYDSDALLKTDDVSCKESGILKNISSSDKGIIGVSTDNQIHLFDLSSRKHITSFNPNQNPQLIALGKHGDVAFSDGKSTVEVFGIDQNKFVSKNTFEIENEVSCLRVAPYGHSVAWSVNQNSWLNQVKSQNNIIQIKDIKSGKSLKELTGHVNSIDAFAFNPHVNALYTIHDERLNIWNLNTGEQHLAMDLEPKTGLEEKEETEQVTSTNKPIATNSGRSVASRMERLRNTIQNPEQAIDRTVNSVSRTADKAARDLRLKAERKVEKTITKFVLEKNQLVISKEGNYMVTKLEGDHIKLYQLNDGIPEYQDIILTTFEKVSDIIISPTEDYIAITGRGEHALYIYNLKNNSQSSYVYSNMNVKINEQKTKVKSLCFSPDGKYLIAQNNKQHIQIIDTQSWQAIKDLTSGTFSRVSPFVGFSEDGHYLFINTEGGIVKRDFPKMILPAFDEYADPLDQLVSIKEKFDGIKSIQLLNSKGIIVQNDIPHDQIISKRPHSLVFTDPTNKSSLELKGIDRSSITNIKVSKQGLVGISFITGELKVVDPFTANELFSMVGEDDNAIFKTPENYYKITKSGHDLVCFRVGKNAYPFEQFDAKFNRPDIVLSAMKSEHPELIDLYKKAYEKRLKKLGLSEDELGSIANIPEVQVTNGNDIPIRTDKLSQKFELKGTSKNENLNKLIVWVNDVPIYGRNGIKVEGKSIERTLELSLIEGINKIQFAVVDSKGIESLKETIEIESTSNQESNLYLISIGTSDYKDSRYNLNYAAKDALDIEQTFTSEEKRYGQVFSKTLTNDQVTKENINDLKTFLKQAKVNDVVIVFVAGHGLLDENYDYYFGTYDIDFLNPSSRGLAYNELESLLDGIKPIKKIMIMDTCHSGEVDKDEIMASEEEVEAESDVMFRAVGPALKTVDGASPGKMVGELFSDLRRGTGTTVISSAGGVEFAMEKGGQYKNGLFTYCLLLSLKEQSADLNNDGKIMLSEIQRKVPALVSDLSGGKQNPNTRMQNIALDYVVW